MSKSVGNVITPASLVRHLRHGPDPLFLPARGAVRLRRQLFARGDRQPDQRRPRQRPRQPRAALAVDDRQELRGQGGRAGETDGGRSGAARRRACPARDRPRGDGASSRSTTRSRRSGRWWPTPTAISPARSRGRRRRPIPTRMATILVVTAEVVRIVAILAQALHAGRDGQDAGRPRRRPGRSHASRRSARRFGLPPRPRSCRRPRRSSRAISRKNRPPEAAQQTMIQAPNPRPDPRPDHRQPLPPRLPRLRAGARRHRRARP